MAKKPTDNLPVTATPAALLKAGTIGKKQTSLAVRRVLKRHHFNPISILIQQVFPQLEPAKQADVIMSLMSFMYPKLKAEETTPTKRRTTKIQVNTQVNVPPAQPQQQIPKKLTQKDYLALLAAAATSHDVTARHTTDNADNDRGDK